MENKGKRIYPATQLVVALDPRVLKVYLWILSWSASQGSVKYYEKQFAKACKMEIEEVERCIQTLVDIKLLDVSRVDQTWMLTPNEGQNNRYYKIPISKVLEGKGIDIADIATWNEECEVIKPHSDMTKEQMKKMILMLQAQLNEAEQVEKLVQTCEPKYEDGLPF